MERTNEKDDEKKMKKKKSKFGFEQKVPGMFHICRNDIRAFIESNTHIQVHIYFFGRTVLKTTNSFYKIPFLYPSLFLSCSLSLLPSLFLSPFERVLRKIGMLSGRYQIFCKRTISLTTDTKYTLYSTKFHFQTILYMKIAFTLGKPCIASLSHDSFNENVFFFLAQNKQTERSHMHIHTHVENDINACVYLHLIPLYSMFFLSYFFCSLTISILVIWQQLTIVIFNFFFFQTHTHTSLTSSSLLYDNAFTHSYARSLTCSW